jgi:hypothetical protein
MEHGAPSAPGTSHQGLPELEGQFEVTGACEEIHAYYTRIELPDGRELPFCGALGYSEPDRIGYPKYEKGPEPDTCVVSKTAPMLIVRSFPKPE